MSNWHSFEDARRNAQQAVEEIRAERGDDEKAHSWEDDLHAGVLRWIAEHGDEQSAGLARVALQTHEIDFVRTCS